MKQLYILLTAFTLINCSERRLEEIGFIKKIEWNDQWQGQVMPMNEINTASDDFGLTRCQLGKVVFFTSTRSGSQQAFSITDGKDLRKLDLGDFKIAGLVYASIDGSDLVAATAEGHADPELKAFMLTAAGWQENPQLITKVNSPYWDSQPYLSPDGKTLVFSSMRPDGEGGKDLYWCRREGESFTTPVNFGPVINTFYDEESPFITPDEKYLIFASNGNPRLGGYDLYFAPLNNMQAGEPQVLPEPINTPYDDMFFYFHPGDSGAVISSNRPGGKGGFDLFQVNHLPIAEGPYFILTGRILANEKRTPLIGKIQMRSAGSDQLITELFTHTVTLEYYHFNLTIPGKLDLMASAKDYLYSSEIIDPPQTKQPVIIHKDFLLNSLYQAIELKVFFDFNQTVLKEGSFADLKSAFRFLQEYPTLKVEISGHTDNVGSVEYNKKLSEARAAAVRDYLVSQGIKEDRIISKGYGSLKPRATNDSEEGRALNRRVEFQALAR